ncbi:MAG: hypothetical protein U0636_10085 [Phycisphaerales bacterium]
MTFDADEKGLPVADLELEQLVAALPFQAPSRRLDARIASAAHFADRPRVQNLLALRWPAATAALVALAAGLALGWSMRDHASGSWVPEGTEWQSAGWSNLGARRLPDGELVHSAQNLLQRTDRYRDPANGAVIEIRSYEPRIIIGRPTVD